MEVLRCENLGKSYTLGTERLKIIEGLDLSVDKGDRLAIMGSSGAGKTTLLNLLGLLSEPDQGRLFMNGDSVTGLGENQRAALRNQHLGFVFQFHHLLPEFSALENVQMPLWLRKNTPVDIEKLSNAILLQVGLGDRLHHKPAELSGGERQRVAIARALVGQPQVLLMDEPTGNLDNKNSELILELLNEINRETGVALVMVTHDQNVAEAMESKAQLIDGNLCF